jgi:NAD(P)-dependent dehydrogenase (short-subunit alcohol dehydrogenase family)
MSDFTGRAILITGGLGSLGSEPRVFGDRLEAYSARFLENQSLKEWITPEDVADLVMFLASDRSRLITGQEFGVNGRW